VERWVRHRRADDHVVSLASPTVADIPSRLAIFLAGCVALFLAGAALSRETRGALEREPVAV
jgi:hypothetical protein